MQGRTGSRPARATVSHFELDTRPALRVGLGIAWAALLIVAVAVSEYAVALLLTPVAIVAGISSVRAHGPVAGMTSRRPSLRPTSPSASGGSAHTGRPSAWRTVLMPPRFAVALAAPVLLAVAALTNPLAAVVVGLLVTAGAAVVLFATAGGDLRLTGRLLGAVMLPAVALASLILARGQGTNVSLPLVAAVCAYDAGAFVMGSQRSELGGPVGLSAGVLAVAAVAFVAAALIVPPFSGTRPWEMFALVGLAAPAGVAVASACLPSARGSGSRGSGSRVPALRRLDSLALAGPLWVIGAMLALHR